MENMFDFLTFDISFVYVHAYYIKLLRVKRRLSGSQVWSRDANRRLLWKSAILDSVSNFFRGAGNVVH